MALDPSIILQAGKGVTKLLTPDEIQEQQMNRELGGMKLAQARQGMADDQALREAYAAGGDVGQTLQQKGLYKPAMEFQKFQSEQQKSQMEAGKATAEAIKNGAGMILANPTEQNAIQVLQDTARQYKLPPDFVDGAKRQIYAARNDPNALKQLAVGWGGDAEKVLGKFTSVNMGGTQEQQRVNPVTGQMEVAGVQARTQSPDSAASVAQSAANAQMTDARLREQNQIRAQGNAQSKIPSGYRLAADGQSLEFIPGGPADPASKAGGGKPLTEGQSKALLFGTRMQEAGTVLDALEKDGKLFSTPGAGTGYGVGAVVNTLNSSKGQQLDQAKRDFLNAVLRRESGAVIADSEFENGNRQYFPQIGDSKEVIAQKKRNREVATRGILAEVPDQETRVGSIRNPTAQNSGGATGTFEAPKGKQPKTKPMNIDGKDFIAELAPDGKYYVQQNGKWFEVR